MAVKVKTKQVKFSDGSKLTVSQANWTIASKLTRLEAAARERPAEDEDAQVFRQYMYPKLAAATVAGDMPTEDEARAMPTAELDKWFLAVREVNPEWFISSADVDEATAEKKRSKRARRS